MLKDACALLFFLVFKKQALANLKICIVTFFIWISKWMSHTLHTLWKFQFLNEFVLQFSFLLQETVIRTKCSVYLNSNGQWVPNGCTLVAGSYPPRCTCFKLASFSMIVVSTRNLCALLRCRIKICSCKRWYSIFILFFTLEDLLFVQECIVT